jgi:preprotein translocase subunit SecB
MIAPLQLIDYTTETVLYERRNTEPTPDDVDVGVELGFGMDAKVDEERDAHCVTLIVRFNLNLEEIPEEVQPYIAHRGEVRVQGWIRWINDEMEKRDDAPELLLTNGLAMLYGIARVHIAQLTDGRSADRLLVPSISFQPMVDEWMNRDAEEPADAQDET